MSGPARNPPTIVKSTAYDRHSWILPPENVAQDSFADPTPRRNTELIFGDTNKRSFFVSLTTLSESAGFFRQFITGSFDLSKRLQFIDEDPDKFLTFLRVLIPSPYRAPVTYLEVVDLLLFSLKFQAWQLYRDCARFVVCNIDSMSHTELRRLLNAINRESINITAPRYSLQEYILQYLSGNKDHCVTMKNTEKGIDRVDPIFRVDNDNDMDSQGQHTLVQLSPHDIDVFFGPSGSNCIPEPELQTGAGDPKTLQGLLGSPHNSRSLSPSSKRLRSELSHENLDSTCSLSGEEKQSNEFNHPIGIAAISIPKSSSYQDETVDFEPASCAARGYSFDNSSTSVEERRSSASSSSSFNVPESTRKRKNPIIAQDYIDAIFVSTGGKRPSLVFRQDLTGKEVYNEVGTFKVQLITDGGKAIMLLNERNLAMQYSVKEFKGSKLKLVEGSTYKEPVLPPRKSE